MVSSYFCSPPSPKCSLRSSLTSLSHKMCHSPQRGLFPTSFLRNPTHLNINISRWESPPNNSTQFSVPDNWKSGRIWVRIFSFLPNSFIAVPGYILFLTFVGAHAHFFLIVFRVAETVTFPRTLDRTVASTAVVMGDCYAIPTLVPCVFPLQYSRTPNSHILCLPFLLSPPSRGRRAGCTARNGSGMDASGRRK